MKTDEVLSRRESEVVNCIVRGYSLRTTAARLHVVYQCIANHLQSIYDKAGIFDHRTLNALTSWWFTTNYGITLDEYTPTDRTRMLGKEVARSLRAICLIGIISASVVCGNDSIERRFSSRTRRAGECELYCED